MFGPVSTKPDLVAEEHAILARWAERRTFARLRAQNAGGPRWSFLDGPITANNPMGVHHAWGRAYKDLYQRFRAMLGHDQRWQNTRQQMPRSTGPANLSQKAPQPHQRDKWHAADIEKPMDHRPAAIMRARRSEQTPPMKLGLYIRRWQRNIQVTGPCR